MIHQVKNKIMPVDKFTTSYSILCRRGKTNGIKSEVGFTFGF